MTVSELLVINNIHHKLKLNDDFHFFEHQHFIWTATYPCISFFSSAPTLNINLEMNYWPSLPCNLRECQEPLFDFIKSLSISGSKVAQVRSLSILSHIKSILLFI